MKRKLNVAMYKRTKIAHAPDELVKALNKYLPNKIYSFVTRKVADLKKADIVHFNNKWVDLNAKQAVVQYHSEPDRVQLNPPKRYKKLVLAQYHATLPEYQGFTYVRNPINFEQPLYNLKEINKFRIGYSPSTIINHNGWYNKGFEETAHILETLAENVGIEYDIINGVSLREAIERKKNCSIIIDECTTSSYHRSALEGLALGKMTICSVGEDVQSIVKYTTDSYLPVENIWIEDLYEYLLNLIWSSSIKEINIKGVENRRWMERYWHPKKIAEEFYNIYKEVLRSNGSK
jgi:hypothetical protein